MCIYIYIYIYHYDICVLCIYIYIYTYTWSRGGSPPAERPIMGSLISISKWETNKKIQLLNMLFQYKCYFNTIFNTNVISIQMLNQMLNTFVISISKCEANKKMKEIQIPKLLQAPWSAVISCIIYIYIYIYIDR